MDKDFLLAARSFYKKRPFFMHERSKMPYPAFKRFIAFLKFSFYNNSIIVKIQDRNDKTAIKKGDEK